MSYLDYLPAWIVYVIFVALIILSDEVGFQLGVRLRRRGVLTEKDSSLGPMIGALLGLLAFFLAFAVSFALSNFTTRRGLVVNEANAIGTAYLRAGYLDEATRDPARELLREYTQQRFIALDPERRLAAIARSEQIQQELWALTEAYASQHPQSISGGLFVEAVNQVIDLQTTRVAAYSNMRLPNIVLWMMNGIIIFTFVLVGIITSADNRRNLVTLTIFALAFAAAVLLVVDLDNPLAGMIEIEQGAMVSLQQMIGTPMP